MPAQTLCRLVAIALSIGNNQFRQQFCPRALQAKPLDTNLCISKPRVTERRTIETAKICKPTDQGESLKDVLHQESDSKKY